MRCVLRWPLLPPTSTYATSHDYLCCLLRVPVLPLMSTCCLPRPPQLRGQLKEVPELVSLEAHGKSTGVIFGVSNGFRKFPPPRSPINRIWLGVSADSLREALHPTE